MSFWKKIQCKFIEYSINNFYYKMGIGVIFFVFCFIHYLNRNRFIYLFFFHLQQGRIIVLLVLVMLYCILKCIIKSRRKRWIVLFLFSIYSIARWFVFSDTVWPIYITSPGGTNTFVIVEEMMGPDKGRPAFYSREAFGYGYVFFCQLYGMEQGSPFNQWEYSYKWLSEDKLEIVISKGWQLLKYYDIKLEFDFNNKFDFSKYFEDVLVYKNIPKEK